MGITGERVIVFDTTLRDGEQSPGAALNVEEKVEIARPGDTGRGHHRGGVPLSPPRRLSGRAAHLPGDPQLHHLRPDTGQSKDIEVAAEALKGAARPRIHTGLGVSDSSRLQHKLRTTREEALEQGVDAVRYAKQFVEDVQYYTEDAGRADP